MKVIGITGGVGCGKSAVLAHLKEKYDAKIIEMDKVAHRLMEPGTAVYKQVVSGFGEDILAENGSINRMELGKRVFGEENQEKLQMLNDITHPAVRSQIQDMICEQRKNGSTNLLIIETALLKESGFEQYCDEIWYIYAREQVRRERLCASRGYTKEKCDSIMENQLSEEQYQQACTVIIDNSDSFVNTCQQIEKALII